MQIPFSKKDFLNVFEQYNTDLWPIQSVFYALAMVAVLSLLLHSANRSQIVNAALSFLWLWMGIVYHIIYFSEINPVAYMFGAIFIVQGLIFGYVGLIKNRLEYKFDRSMHGISGIGFVIYGFVLYPILSHFSGLRFPESPTFGLPCPTTIFTLGFLLTATTKGSWYVFIIPLLWSFIGFSAAIDLSIKQDFALGIAGIIVIILLFLRKKLVIAQYPAR